MARMLLVVAGLLAAGLTLGAIASGIPVIIALAASGSGVTHLAMAAIVNRLSARTEAA